MMYLVRVKQLAAVAAVQRRVRNLAWRPALLALSLVLGCGRASMEAEEEAHHEFPPHRPVSYEQLVSELERRVTLHQTGGSDPWAEAELRDLVIWLPEFAADSELKRQDFDEAVQLGKRLQSELAVGGVLSGDRVDRVEKSLQGLRELVVRSRDPNGAVQP